MENAHQNKQEEESTVSDFSLADEMFVREISALLAAFDQHVRALDIAQAMDTFHAVRKKTMQIADIPRRETLRYQHRLHALEEYLKIARLMPVIVTANCRHDPHHAMCDANSAQQALQQADTHLR